MKKYTILLLTPFFCGAHLFGQELRSKPLAEKTVVQNPQIIRPAEESKKPAPPAPAPQNIQNVVVDIQNGDDGKDNDTYVRYDFEDNSKRVAATYNDGSSSIYSRPNDIYVAGSSISVPLKTQMSIPDGQTIKVGAISVPGIRYSTPADFSNGGEIKITIDPNGHDTWKISTIDVKVSFANDPHSPHDIRWSNIVLSQDGRIRELLFDKNFNPL